MRILCVHNRYQQKGGEDEIFDAESALLETHGHTVSRLEFHSDDIPARPNPIEATRIALSSIWSRDSARKVALATRTARAEIVHFTNTFPIASPSVYSAAKREGGAVVQTVQNYRMVCPSATLYRDNHVCEDCLGRKVAWPGIVHACYHNSRAQTAVVATMLATHRMLKTWTNDVDMYIAATEFSREKLVEGGLVASKIVVKPNFVARPRRPEDTLRSGFLFVGRLAPEKGIAALMDAVQLCPDNIRVRVAGDTRLPGQGAETTDASSRVVKLGRLDREQVQLEMVAAEALVFPSEWYEPFGLVAIEAFAQSTPVIASKIGGIPELVKDGRTGLLFEAGNAADLATKMRWANEHPTEMRVMGEQARREYESKYTPERNYRMLIDIYELAMKRASLPMDPGEEG